MGALSGGEQRFLLLAASFGGGEPVILSDVLSGLDRDNLELVPAAVSHAGGSHEHSGMTFVETGHTQGLHASHDAVPMAKEERGVVLRE